MNPAQTDIYLGTVDDNEIGNIAVDPAAPVAVLCTLGTGQCLIVANNDDGGIFSTLEQAPFPPRSSSCSVPRTAPGLTIRPPRSACPTRGWGTLAT